MVMITHRRHTLSSIVLHASNSVVCSGRLESRSHSRFPALSLLDGQSTLVPIAVMSLLHLKNDGLGAAATFLPLVPSRSVR
jgi:hypothetical protein